MTGIYMIKNLINGKRYIGKSKNIKRRWYEHKSSSSMQYSDLKHDIKKFGIEKFKLEILEKCPEDRLDEYNGPLVKTTKKISKRVLIQ